MVIIGTTWEMTRSICAYVIREQERQHTKEFLRMQDSYIVCCNRRGKTRSLMRTHIVLIKNKSVEYNNTINGNSQYKKQEVNQQNNRRHKQHKIQQYYVGNNHCNNIKSQAFCPNIKDNTKWIIKCH